MAEFILETFCRSKRVIPKTDNSSKCKSEDEFCSVICLDILSGKKETLRKYRNQSLSCETFRFVSSINSTNINVLLS